MMETSKQAATVHDDDDECNHSCTTMEMMVVVALPEDLILEILFRVRSISILRFKSVCKKWYSLISNPDFLQKFHGHPQRLLDHSDDFLLVSIVEDNLPLINTVDDKQEENNPIEYAILPQQNQNQEQRLKVFLDHALSVFIPQKFSSFCSFRLIDSCNGLLLYRNGDPIPGVVPQYHVFNPITKQCFELLIMEPLQNILSEVLICWAHIVFDPSVSLSFKVFMCFSRSGLYGFGIYVYSSETSSWICLIDVLPNPNELLPLASFFNCHYRAVLLGGMLYLYTYMDKLLCFDVVKDKIRFLPLPPTAMEHHNRNLLYFGECGGRLRLIERYSSSNSYRHHIVTYPFSFDIMELEDVPDAHDPRKIRNWTVKYRVNMEMSYEDHIPLAAQIIRIYKTGGATAGKTKGEDEDEALLFLNIDRKAVISYNLTSNTFGEEQKISNFDHTRGLHAFPYSPTLLTLS